MIESLCMAPSSKILVKVLRGTSDANVSFPELCNLLDFQNYVTETYDWYSFQYSAIQQEQNIYGQAGEMAFYYFVWPNFMLNILPDRLQTNLVLPYGHDRCIVLFDYYYDDVESDEARKRADADIEYSHKIQL